ncbi:MAG: NAD(+) diphosphatase [Novosphingobium sp.]
MSGAAIAFAGSRIDRADHIRADPQALLALQDWRARLLLLDGLDPRVDAEGGLAWGSLADADPAAELVFLGLDPAGKGCFAPVPPAGSAAPGNPRMWLALAALSGEDLAAYGTARSLVNWHARHRFCAVCGSPTQPAKGGWQRDCSACSAEHFPRVDPVTIMLVQHEDNLLLGRQPRFPQGNYSALAGFVEPGESLEEAVAREVHEEAGVVVRDVTYIASQPWPFPSNLMIGCLSHADDPALTIDRTELEDARWFTRAEVAEAIAAADRGENGTAFNAPGRQAIASHLMRWWLAR